MWLILQQEKAENFVIATGQTWTVKQFVEFAFNEIGINITLQGQCIDEVGLDSKTREVLVKVNPRFFRPAEVELLLGNPSKAEEILKWKKKLTLKN
jgi:GDPmannose 4,6-dehydratase